MNGIVVITNQRVVFATSTLGDSDTVSIYLEDIKSVDSSGNNLTGAVLRIQGPSTALSIDANKKTLTPVRDKIDEAIYLTKRENSFPTTIIQEASAADEILKYKHLFDEGIITQEEFEAKKKQLLGL